MIEITIHGRGGQGGVTLAKLIAISHFLKGAHAQAFGVYAAERSGAPLQAFVRIDDKEITVHNHVRHPDHLIVLDRTLIGPHLADAMSPDGWIILNTADAPQVFAEVLPGRNVATIDATGIAVQNQLGTRTVPIVNTTLHGAVARVLGQEWADAEAGLRELRFTGANLTAARQAYEAVQSATLAGARRQPEEAAAGAPPVGLLDPDVGAPPKLRTGAWATRQPKRQSLQAPCTHACPAGNDVPGFVAALRRNDPDEALRILLETSPMPGVCGRVCPAPCMEACNRNLFDEPVQVRELERYAAEQGRRPKSNGAQRRERVAIVGSGPAGLACAYHLGRLGYRVALFEAGRELGGLLRTGIPAYRLPRDVLDEEIDYILRHHVTADCGQFINRERLLQFSHQFDAVFVAVGLQELWGLELGADAEGAVIQGIEFLDRARKGAESCDKQRVVVVGGGNTAVDAARTALRTGARHVHIVYRRTRAEMPAIPEEIDEALAEGVALDELVQPLRLRADARGAVLTCARMALGPPDQSGRRRPVPETSEDAAFDLPCDRVILALGQAPDLSIMPEGAEVNQEHELLGLTGAPVVLGGDLATNEGTVAHAIGNGRLAALHIHRTLTGEDLFPPPSESVATPALVHMHLFEHAPAEHPAEAPPRVRRRSFTEVRQTYVSGPQDAPARREAERCFTCGTCTECDRCVEYCPEGILLHRADGAYDFNYDYCKGCGVCASQCPRGVVYMTEL